MRNPKASCGVWRDVFRVLKLCVMGISMVSVPLFLKPLFVGTREFFSMAIPRVHETLSAWLTPAFLYLILNCIILAIVANSGVGIFSFAGAASSHQAESCSPSPHQQEEEKEEKGNPIVCESIEESSAEEEKSQTMTNADSDSDSASAAVAAADTLEATWIAITEARKPPPTRQLRKSDTWQTRRPHPPEPASLAAVPRFGKSETWNSGRNLDRETVGAEMLKKEPSLGQDELNKRVEAFIAKVNHDMKLQREESLLHYREMVKRGSR